MPYEIQTRANDGTYTSTLNGVPNYGTALGVTNTRFQVEGSVLDAIGTFSFRLPLTIYRNNGIRNGTRIDLTDVETGLVMARGYVVKRDVTEQNGVEYAQVSCVDMADDLRRANVTTGFATATGERLYTTGLRLARLADAPWTFVTDVTGFDGVAFSANGVSIAAAYGKLAGERFCHWTRLSTPANSAGVFTRCVSLSTFGQVSGFVLDQPAANPTQARAVNATLRQIQPGGFQFSEDGNVVNALIPTGAGNGVAQVTLRPLYNAVGETLIDADRQIYQSGPVSFQGQDARYPIRKRPTQDGGASVVGGYEYFIQDEASVAANGRWWGNWQQQGISVIADSSGAVSDADMYNAAVALYAASVGHIQWNAVQKVQYTITTEGHGDLRGLAGKTVRVKYRGYAQERGDPSYKVSIDLDTDFTALLVEVSEDQNGTQTAQWTVSNTGQFVASDTSALVGAIQQIQIGGLTVQPYPGFESLPLVGVADRNHPLVRTFPGNQGIVQVMQVKLNLAVVPVVLGAMPKVHGHASPLPAIPHDIGNAGADVTHDINTPTFEFEIGGATVANQAAIDYNPSTSLHVASGNPSGHAQVLMLDPSTRTLYLQGGSGGVDVSLPSEDLSIIRINPSTGGTGGTVKSTDDGTQPGKGGKTVTQDDFTTDTKDVDGVTDAVGMTFGHYENPAPLPPVTVKIGATTVGTLPAGGGALDCTVAVPVSVARGDFTITITPSTATGNVDGLCEMYGTLRLRTVLTMLNVSV